MPKKIRTVSLIVFSVAIWALLIYGFVFFQLVRVPTGAMANTIVPGDHLIVKKRAFGEIKRGDIVVISYPDDPERYIKRVIGLPGETIEIRSQSIYINGTELPERRVIIKDDPLLEAGELEELSSSGDGMYRVFYLPRDSKNAAPDNWNDRQHGVSELFKIPNDHYFVMGDNRDNSMDSRDRGPVARASVFGKPKMIYWSAHRNYVSHEDEIRWNRIFKSVR